MEFEWEVVSDPGKLPDVLSKIPSGVGREIGLLPSIPAVRVWGCIQFDRAFSGNERQEINEAVTDLEPFLYEKDGKYEFDSRARIRATKFNYVRESFFRETLRRIMLPFQNAIDNDKNGEEAKSYLKIVEEVANEILKDDAAKRALWNVVVKMASCTPLDPCGVCPACIAEGAAASTATQGAVPVNWEKKYKETDFKTYFTVKSAAKELGLPAGSQILEPSLLEKVVRNRVPRAGTTQEGGTSEEMMFFVEYMFKGPGYFKTTLFNPTRLELAMLAYEHLVKDVRKGAKTSSGAGVWDHCVKEDMPLIVVDEILSVEGYLANPPPPSMPIDVRDPETGYRVTFFNVVGDCRGICVAKLGEKVVLVRYVGEQAIKRLEKYMREGLSLLEGDDAFRLLVEHAASVIDFLGKPKRVQKNYSDAIKDLVPQQQKKRGGGRRSKQEEEGRGEETG